jgi:predicted GH43/DUF377 family glycosyl hydrolase
MMLAIPLFTLVSFTDLEERRDSFVEETRKIEIPEYPNAFNPSIVRWQDMLLMSFRVIPDRKQSFTSYLGIVKLDENFCPRSTPQLFELRKNSAVPCRAEDARLIVVKDRLMIAYSDNEEPKISKAGFRMYLAEVLYDGVNFSLKDIERISKYEGESKSIREKNWVAFDYEGHLLLSYSLSPHKVFLPVFGTETCDTLFTTNVPLQWKFGILRGGTPAIKIGDEYLSIFHSSISMSSLQSQGQTMLHYFMGAYTFSASPPFELKRMSKEPIVGKDFYNGPNHYKPYWKPGMYIFPAGILIEQDTIWLAYGRQDHEIWIAKLGKRGLLDSLIDIPAMPYIEGYGETDTP